MLVVSLSIAYYFVYFLPQNELQKQEVIEAREQALEVCLQSAEGKGVVRETYNVCAALSEAFDAGYLSGEALEKFTDRISHCPQEALSGMDFIEYVKELKNDCFRKYPKGGLSLD